MTTIPTQSEQRLNRQINKIPPDKISIQRMVYLEDGKTPAHNFFSSSNSPPKPSKDYMLLSGAAVQHDFAVGLILTYKAFQLAFAPRLVVNGRTEERVYFIHRTTVGIESPPFASKETNKTLQQIIKTFTGGLKNFLLSIIDFGTAGGSLVDQPVPAHHRGRIIVKSVVDGVAHRGGWSGQNFAKATYFKYVTTDHVISYPYMRYLIGKDMWRSLPPNYDATFRRTHNVRSMSDLRKHASAFDWSHPLYKSWYEYCTEWNADPFEPPKDPRRMKR